MKFVKLDQFMDYKYDPGKSQVDRKQPVYKPFYLSTKAEVTVGSSTRTGHSIISVMGVSNAVEVKGGPDAIVTKLEAETEPKVPKSSTTKSNKK